MTYGPTTRMLDQMAETLLPMMDDPRAFDGPPPQCDAAAHDWSIVHDKQVEWQLGDATGTTTCRVAIECGHCNWVVGMG